MHIYGYFSFWIISLELCVLYKYILILYSLQNGTNYPIHKQITLQSYSVRNKNKDLRKKQWWNLTKYHFQTFGLVRNL